MIMPLLSAASDAMTGVSPEAFYAFVGFVVSALSWLTIRHYTVSKPTYDRVFGVDDDETNPGHLVETREGFDRIADSQERLAHEIERTNDKIDRLSTDRPSDASTFARADDSPWRPTMRTDGGETEYDAN